MERPNKQLEFWPGFQKRGWDRITSFISAQSSFFRESFCNFHGKVKSLYSNFLPYHATPPLYVTSVLQLYVHFCDFGININTTPQAKCKAHEGKIVSLWSFPI